jgi:N-glycosylase/DNA lyase
MERINRKYEHRLPCQDEDVIPGVKWGRPEWVPSPAFWWNLARLSDQSDDFVSPPGTSLESTVIFCLLGGHGITAEVNQAAFVRLREAGAIDLTCWTSVQEVETLLREPLVVGGRFIRYRFPHQKAKRVVSALARLKERPPPLGDVQLFRQYLMNLPGIGPKTASWIARNWLGSDDVAILDVHVIRACQIMGVFGLSIKIDRDYYALERRFLDFAQGLGVRASLLDAIIWREMRQLRWLRPLR